jgi:hypothetical protein
LAPGRTFEVGDLGPGRNVTLDTPLGGIDVVQRAGGFPSFDELDAAAVDTDIQGVPVRICSLAHLRAMRKASGRAIDRADLEELPPLTSSLLRD